MKNAEIIKIEKATGIRFGMSGKEVNGRVWGTSYYLNLRGKKIRVSDHKNTTDKFAKPDYNFLYDESNEVISIINQLLQLPKESYEVDVIRPLFNDISEIITGVYHTERGKIEIVKIENDTATCIFPDGNEKNINISFVMNWKGITTEIKFIS